MKFVAGTALAFLVASILVTIMSASAATHGDQDRTHDGGTVLQSASKEAKSARQEIEGLRSDVAELVALVEVREDAKLEAKEEALKRAGLVVVDVDQDGSVRSVFDDPAPATLRADQLGQEISSKSYGDGKIVVISPRQGQEELLEPDFAPAAAPPE